MSSEPSSSTRPASRSAALRATKADPERRRRRLRRVPAAARSPQRGRRPTLRALPRRPPAPTATRFLVGRWTTNVGRPDPHRGPAGRRAPAHLGRAHPALPTSASATARSSACRCWSPSASQSARRSGRRGARLVGATDAHSMRPGSHLSTLEHAPPRRDEWRICAPRSARSASPPCHAEGGEMSFEEAVAYALRRPPPSKSVDGKLRTRRPSGILRDRNPREPGSDLAPTTRRTSPLVRAADGNPAVTQPPRTRRPSGSCGDLAVPVRSRQRQPGVRRLGLRATSGRRSRAPSRIRSADPAT